MAAIAKPMLAARRFISNKLKFENKMENLKQKLEIVIYYMNNIDKFSGEFWENLKATKLAGKDEQYINDVSDLIDEWINDGKVAFYSKYSL